MYTLVGTAHLLKFLKTQTYFVCFQVIWRKVESALPITRWTLKDTEYLENKQILKIHSVDWIHNGTYSCLVKNKLGIEKRRFELYVF